MIGKKEINFVESLSRRSFVEAGSAALAAAAFAGLTADAQRRDDTLKAESDHSSSNPGQENRPLLDENPNSNTPPPTDHGDIGPIWYSFDLARKRVEGGGWTHQVTPARTAAINRTHRRQHAAYPWQLPRIELAHSR